MSTSLGWMPVTPNDYEWLDCSLKFAMQKRYGGHVSNVVLDENDIPYLEGLRDAGVKDADKLINAIWAHNAIKVTEE